MQPFLSVLIPTFNSACSLWRTLNSITTQREFLFSEDVEIIIFDNSYSIYILYSLILYLLKYFLVFSITFNTSFMPSSFMFF